MGIAVALLVACIAGVAVSALVQQAITAEMEIRLGDPANVSFWALVARGRSFQIEKEFKQRFAGDRLTRRLRVARIIFFACAAGAAVTLFGVLPHWAPPSR